jgi:shikimate kinase
MKIFFVGYMASGKSSLGKRIANRLNLSFVDMDKEIERLFDLTIPEIFRSLGEDAFREAENQFLKNLSNQDETLLIATGGGAPCFKNNMMLMNELGLTVYLERSAKELAHRIHHSKKSRPLVDHLPEDELLLFVQKHLNERESFYQQSQLTIERNDQTTSALSELLLPYLSAFSKNKKR